MMFDQTTWVGINSNTQSGKGRGVYIYAALDNKLHTLALQHADLDEIKTYLDQLPSAVVGVAGPRRLIFDEPLPSPQAALFPEELAPKTIKVRLADRQLREHNLGHPLT